MVAKAFALGEDAFPRISSSEYASLEKALGNQLRRLYKHVEAPIAAPWKSDYASIHFVVCDPLADGARANMKGALGAKLEKIEHPNNTISLFAIPTSAAGEYYRVEVHECQTKEELDCAKFYLSYGDLGQIFSLIARVYGFTFGTKGIKTHYSEPHDKKLSGFLLSESPEKIMRFFGLQVDAWNRGFKSQDDIFAWVGTSRFFNATQLLAEDAKNAKKADLPLRKMYYSFVTYTAAHKQSDRVPNTDAVREDALLFFGVKAKYNEQVQKNLFDRARREKFNGTKVMAWTSLRGIIIREIMAKVRERVGIEGIINLDEKALKDEVLVAQKEVPVQPQVKKA